MSSIDRRPHLPTTQYEKWCRKDLRKHQRGKEARQSQRAEIRNWIMNWQPVKKVETGTSGNADRKPTFRSFETIPTLTDLHPLSLAARARVIHVNGGSISVKALSGLEVRL